MNHVQAVALRSPGLCLRPTTWLAPSSILSTLQRVPAYKSLPASVLCLAPVHSTTKSFLSCPTLLSRSFSTRPSNNFQSTCVRYAIGRLTLKDETERGLAFGEKVLTEQDLYQVFPSPVPPTQLANRLLRVVHGRRVDGTLDLPLPNDLVDLIEEYPYALDSALYWLRENYDVDEDGAIIARLDREASGYDGRTPSQLRQRAQDLKLYGPQMGKFDDERRDGKEPEIPTYFGPQSGRYQAKLGEKGDIYGVSEFEKMRVENEAKVKKEDEELEQQIEDIQTKRIAQSEAQRSQALATRPEQAIESVNDEEVRPPNEFEKWVLRAKNRASSKLTIHSPEIRDKTLTGRLLPSFIFAALFCAGCWYFSRTWQTPKRSDRWFPSTSLSFATIATIVAVNVSIFIFWRFPPFWGLLNRYYLVIPATPNPFSLLGNIFSHVQSRHLLLNMLPLLVFGPSLHEDMGRGNFMALYLASGVLGSFASLTNHAARGILTTTSLGASGSIWAVTAAFFNIHSDNDFTIFFIPDDWKDQAHIKGWALFSILITMDLMRALRGRPITIDYVAHATGALSGWIISGLFKKAQAQTQEDGEFSPKAKLPWWQVILQEGGNQDKGSS